MISFDTGFVTNNYSEQVLRDHSLHFHCTFHQTCLSHLIPMARMDSYLHRKKQKFDSVGSHDSDLLITEEKLKNLHLILLFYKKKEDINEENRNNNQIIDFDSISSLDCNVS